MKPSDHNISSVDDCRFIDIPLSPDGSLADYQNLATAPFPVRRVFYTYNIPAGSERGGHSHYHMAELVIALRGSFEIRIDDGLNKRRITLDRPDRALLLPAGIWRTLHNFTQGAICLALASEPFDEADYVRHYDQFLKLTQSKRK